MASMTADGIREFPPRSGFMCRRRRNQLGLGFTRWQDRWQSGVGGSSVFARLAGYVNQGGSPQKWQNFGKLASPMHVNANINPIVSKSFFIVLDSDAVWSIS
jgi:hypothetical protein